MLLLEKIFQASEKAGVDLYDEQRTVCLHYCRGKDVVFAAPTGFGKSVVFTLAPLILKGCVIVVEPTIALVEDQMAKLSQLNLGLNTVHLKRSTVEEARYASFLFTSPESLLDERCGKILLKDATWCTSVCCVFVDECHLVHEWGEPNRNDWNEFAFRDKFSMIGEIRSFLVAPMVAMTATATSETLLKVTSSLAMMNYEHVAVDMNKENIMYNVVNWQTKEASCFDWLVNLVKKEQSNTPRVLVFFQRLEDLTETYAYVKHELGDLCNAGYPLVSMFHSLTPEALKRDIIHDMNEVNGDIRVVFCTTSFSVGVSLKRVEFVIHYGSPLSISEFVQTTGRASRERRVQGYSVLMTYPRMFAGRRPSQVMRDYCRPLESCRRALILAAFDTIPTVVPLCCDICNPHYFHPVLRLIKSSACITSCETSSISSSSSISLNDF